MKYTKVHLDGPDVIVDRRIEQALYHPETDALVGFLRYELINYRWVGGTWKAVPKRGEEVSGGQTQA